MGETNQPFTEHVTRTRSLSQTSASGWIVAGIMAMLTAVFLFLWLSSRADRHQMDDIRAKLDEATTNLSNAMAENQANQDQIAVLKARVADLEKEREHSAQMAQGLEKEMRADLESKDVTISKLQGKLTVTILDRVMFDSGEAVLKPDGEAVMRKVGVMLGNHPELKIHVIGHTDNVPIRQGAHTRFASNWELSLARALAAVHFLTEQAGVDPRRVGAVGYGEYRPMADNSTPEGRAKNRRIAISIMPEELAWTDTVPATNASESTSSP